MRKTPDLLGSTAASLAKSRCQSHAQMSVDSLAKVGAQMLLSEALQKGNRSPSFVGYKRRRWEGREEVDEFRDKVLAAVELWNFSCLQIGRSC